ncbi:hypothetical protein ScalyP_jg2437 [Parmales sp. scaly parma]|nr:hypothetical protein ScalyP_jg2437 [Parmales sp. scaly parma]
MLRAFSRSHLFRQARFSTSSTTQKQARADYQNAQNTKFGAYTLAVVIGVVGATYASVPLYKIFCQATGFGGTTQRTTLEEYAEKQANKNRTASDMFMDKLYSMSNVPGLKKGVGHGGKTWTDEEAAERLKSLKPVENGRLIRVTFDSNVSDMLPWKFTPTQPSVKVVPGETALSFFTATNNSKKAITGVATYNVYPPSAGLYFNKIQCFCFEEQRLLPGEEVDMPVFFFIDPDFATDPSLDGVNNITLSYTFFQTEEDEEDLDA